MPIPLINSQQQLEMGSLYFLSSLVRAGYQPDNYQPFKSTAFGQAGQNDWTLFDYKSQKRAYILSLPDTTIIGSTGLVATDWPYVLLNGQHTVDARGIFAGQMMAPLLQVWTWTWPTLQLYVQQTPADREMIFVGHSFGGALSVLYAWKAKEMFPTRTISVLMFGAPRFADATFSASVPVPVFRIENQGDPIPSVPSWLGYYPVGKGYTLRRSGVIYPPFQQVPMADGSLIDGAQAMLLEKYPRAIRQENGATQYGANDAAVLEALQSYLPDMHSSAEYVRQTRRFLSSGAFPTVDAVNDVFNQQDGISWRIPLYLPMPFSPDSPLNCQAGLCPPGGC